MAQQRNNVQAPISRLFANRWSPRAFDPERQVSNEQIAICLEAARWAPSCYGDQPWRFIVADRFSNPQAWQSVYNTLAPANQSWAERAPVLIVAVSLRKFTHNGNPNRWSAYDTGQATLSLCLQATALGLASHQMGGFDSDALQQALNIPEDADIMSVTALGHIGNPDTLDADLQSIETAPRTRLSLADISHNGAWEQPFQPLLSLGWQARYEESSAEELPWFHHTLDPDFARALGARDLTGMDALDIGCGPGTQAIALAKKGACVTATDVAQAAIDGAQTRAEREGVSIAFIAGDATTMTLAKRFDLIIDRGVLHCFAAPDQRTRYIKQIRNWLKPGGMLLLKCFSHQEKREQGPPCRFSPEDLQRMFAEGFTVSEISEAQFQGSDHDAPPKALFATIRRNTA